MADEILQYVKGMKNSGHSEQLARKRLLDAGWEKKEIDESLAKVFDKSTPDASFAGEKDIGGVLKESWFLFTQKPKLWLTYLGIYILLIIGFAIILIPTAFLGYALDRSFMISYLVFVVPLLVLAGLGVYMAFIRAVASELEGDSLSVGEAFRFGVSKSIVALGAMFLSMPIILLGFVLLIIPGVYISVYLLFYLHAIALDGETVIGSLKKSYTVIKGRWWVTFAFFVILMIAGQLGQIFAFVVDAVGSNHLGIVLFILLFIGFQVVLSIYFQIAMVSYYINARDHPRVA